MTRRYMYTTNKPSIDWTNSDVVWRWLSCLPVLYRFVVSVDYKHSVLTTYSILEKRPLEDAILGASWTARRQTTYFLAMIGSIYVQLLLPHACFCTSRKLRKLAKSASLYTITEYLFVWCCLELQPQDTASDDLPLYWTLRALFKEIKT